LDNSSPDNYSSGNFTSTVLSVLEKLLRDELTREKLVEEEFTEVTISHSVFLLSMNEVYKVRPISLTSFFLNTMERLVDSYIKAGSLKSFPLMASQYGYQKGRSTEAEGIEGSLNQKKFALNIDGAFDNASFGVVLTLRRWINAMLRCRSLRVEIRGGNVRTLVNRRCQHPTGSSTVPSVVNVQCTLSDAGLR
jgi:hypothetical protein